MRNQRQPATPSPAPTALLAILGLILILATLAPADLQGQQPTIEQVGFHVFGPAGGGGPFVPFAGVLCPNDVPPFLHWDLREFPSCGVPYEINGSIPLVGGITSQPGVARTNTAVRLAANTWSAAAPAYINLFDNSAATPTACPVAPTMDNRNCVAWDPAFSFTGFLGVTFLWRNATTGIMLESDITMNPLYRWQGSPPTCTGGAPYGIQAVLLHELGHFLGLAHPDQFAPGQTSCVDDDTGQQSRMFSIINNSCNTQLHQADRDGINYLYTADLGDAADPSYPSLIHDPATPSGRVLSGVPLLQPNDGAEHLFGIYADPLSNNSPRYQYEWMALCCGAIDDHPSECDARLVDNDNFDDGVAIIGTCLPDNTLASPLRVLMGVLTSRDVIGRVHDYTTRPMFLNSWFDWNNDGDWDDGNEHVVNGLRINGRGIFARQIPVPPDTPCDVKSRFRLDWGEDVGRRAPIEPSLNLVRYAAQHGEVEDYIGLKPLPWNVYCHEVQGFDVGFPAVLSRVNIDEICHPPKIKFPIEEPNPVFPAGGSECMESTLTLDLDVDGDNEPDEVIGFTGPVCVTRSDPYFDPNTGLKVIDTVMDSLEMVGSSEFAGTMIVRLAPDFTTIGQIRQTEEAAAMGVDISLETPADSFFNVYFQVESETMGLSEIVGPADVTAQITSVPPGEVIGEEPPPEDPDQIPTETPPEDHMPPEEP